MYIWLEPETIAPSGYGNGGLNLQTMTPYDDSERTVGSPNILTDGLTGYEIQNNFLNLGELALNASNRLITLELGQQAIVGDEVFKGTVLYTGRKNSSGSFFAGGQATLTGNVDITDATAIFSGRSLETTLEYKIGLNQDNLFTVTIDNTGAALITDKATLLDAINDSLLNNSLTTTIDWYGFTSVGLGTYPILIHNNNTLNIIFDNDATRYSYTYTYVSPDGLSDCSIANRPALISWLQSALNQATSDAEPGIEAPPITTFVPTDAFTSGTGAEIKLTLTSKAANTNGTSKGSLVVSLKGDIPVAIGMLDTEENKAIANNTITISAFDFSSILTAADYDDPNSAELWLYITGENNESSSIILSNKGIADAKALFLLLGAISSDSYEKLDHTKAPAVSSDADIAFSTQLLYGGPFAIPKLTVSYDWEELPIKIHPNASTVAEKKSAFYLDDSLAPYDTTDEDTALIWGGVLSPGNLALPLYTTGGNPPTPSPEYSKFMYNTSEHKIYIYDTVLSDWVSSDFCYGASLCVFKDDFLGYKLNKYIAGENTSALWCTIETDINLVPDVVANIANGIVQLTLDSDNITQKACLYWGNQLSLGATQGLIFEARVCFHVLPTTGAETVQAVFGLASADNAILDNISINAWFRCESSAQTSLLFESDDNTANNDDDNVVAGLTLVVDTFHTYTIDMTDITAVKFYVDHVLKGTTTMAALTTQTVQPYFCMSKIKDANNTGTGTLYADSIYIWTNRT